MGKKKQKLNPRDWKEINLKEKYIIFRDKPRTKVPIEDGICKIDLGKGILTTGYKLKNKKNLNTCTDCKQKKMKSIREGKDKEVCRECQERYNGNRTKSISK